ncbi:hypothetical protein AC781_02435 [Akkermansia glycaniphila]|nr:hypothetical protein AC781_02435 [Akkermansia glycaniphila]
MKQFYCPLIILGNSLSFPITKRQGDLRFGITLFRLCNQNGKRSVLFMGGGGSFYFRSIICMRQKKKGHTVVYYCFHVAVV